MALQRTLHGQASANGNLIRCRAVDDFREICAQYEPRFAEALLDQRSARAKRLCKVLEKVGLAMTSGRIVISNEPRWTSISMIARVPTRLPSTTNALESFHGHGNEQTPRRNDFLRVATMMTGKTFAFRSALEETFGLMMRKVRRRAKATDPTILGREVEQYGTTPGHCRCGETCHSSAISGISCPCSHQYWIGVEKPRVPDINLELGISATALTLVLEHLDRADGDLPSDEDLARWQEHAVRQIKNFSHSRKTTEIRVYVQEHFQVGNGFALGLPVSVFGLISEGISHFSE